jgi:N-acetyl-gamma-glutamyl-phosphate reductase
MVKVGIIGHTGRVGKPLLEILSKHPYAEIVYTESKSKGYKGNLRDTELVFLALPYSESKKYLPRLKGKRIIDLSIDHRNDNGWVYGLPELNKDKIKNAQRVANPGCYATSVILG